MVVHAAVRGPARARCVDRRPCRRRALLSGAAGLLAATQHGAASARQPQPSVFEGNYDDPSHPGCRREIRVSGNKATVYGADPVPIEPGAPCRAGEAVSPWELEAEITEPDSVIVIDFDPIDKVKQGPATGRWVPGKGLRLPNGLWTKKGV